MGLAANIGAYIWKTLPFWTVILLAGRMAIPQELYEAAAVDGATGLRRFAHVTLPLMANLYLVCVLLDTVFALGDFNATYFVSGGGPAMSTEVLATLGIRYAFTVALPRLGVADGHDGAAGADPAGLHPDAQAADVGGAAVSVATRPRRHSPLALPAAAPRGGSRLHGAGHRADRLVARADLQHGDDRA